MRRIIVVDHVTLDGVMQAPGGREEDTRDGFKYGGWAVPYQDEVIMGVMAEGMKREGDLLLGRKTYEHFANFWPKQKDNPYTEVLNKTQKFVASRTLTQPLPWQNSTVLKGDAGEAVAALKQDGNRGLTILGSGDLVQTLLRRNLIDEFQLTIHPLVLGSGRRLFRDDGPTTKFKLTGTKTSTTGVIIAFYQVET